MTNKEAITVLKNHISPYDDCKADNEANQAIRLAIKALEKRPQSESIIKCKDCKYRIKEWREDKRMKEKGYWAYGCEHFGDIMGYWGFGGNDNEFCSDAERRTD